MAAGSKLSVLSAEELVEESAPLDAAALQAVLQEMRENFDYVFVDVPRHMISTQRRLIAEASAVIVITEQSLVGIRDTLRIKMALKSIDPTLPVLVVTARHAKDRPAHIDAATFEKTARAKSISLFRKRTKSRLKRRTRVRRWRRCCRNRRAARPIALSSIIWWASKQRRKKRNLAAGLVPKDDKVKDKKT